MSIEVPIYDKNILGSEYLMIQQDSRDRGLQNPSQKNPVIDNENNEYPIDLGLNDPSILLQNNDNPSETQQFTDAQALLNIQMEGSLDRPMSMEEQELREFVSHDLNNNLRLKLVEEADRMGDHIYSNQSQDFVNQYREDIASYVKELNLYLQDVPTEYKDTPAERAELEGQELSPADAMVQALLKMNKEQQEEVKRKFVEREQFVPRSEPPLEEKLKPKQKGKPEAEKTGIPKGFKRPETRRARPFGKETPEREGPREGRSPVPPRGPQPTPSKTPRPTPSPSKPQKREGRKGRATKEEL